MDNRRRDSYNPKIGLHLNSSTVQDVTFQQMNFSRSLLEAVTKMNFVHPTKIQAATSPAVLKDDDAWGCAAISTSRTVAYMLPVLETLLHREDPIVSRVLVLVPTREVGIQVCQVTKQLAEFTTIEVGLSVGGLVAKVEEAELIENPDILIATPKRLIHHREYIAKFSPYMASK